MFQIINYHKEKGLKCKLLDVAECLFGFGTQVYALYHVSFLTASDRMEVVYFGFVPWESESKGAVAKGTCRSSKGELSQAQWLDKRICMLSRRVIHHKHKLWSFCTDYMTVDRTRSCLKKHSMPFLGKVDIPACQKVWRKGVVQPLFR